METDLQPIDLKQPKEGTTKQSRFPIRLPREFGSNRKHNRHTPYQAMVARNKLKPKLKNHRKNSLNDLSCNDIMISYLLPLLAFALFFYNPIYDFLTAAPPQQVRRTPLPQINTELLALESSNETSSKCGADLYSIHVFSRDPLVIYIENFLSLAERRHLLDIR